MKRFIVLTAARSGSNLLIEFLNQHPHILSKRELFSPTAGTIEAILRDPISYCVDKLDDQSSEEVWRGFKIFYVHATPAFWGPLPTFIPNPSQRVIDNRKKLTTAIADEDPDDLASRFSEFWNFLKQFHVIHLERSNLLKMYCSLRMAYLTDSWVAKDRLWSRIFPRFMQKKKPKPRLKLSYKDCNDYFEFIDQIRHKRLEHFAESKLITVHYESLSQNPQKVLNKIHRFLDVEPKKCRSSSIRKQSVTPITETIKNYEELKESFSGTRWWKFFE